MEDYLTKNFAYTTFLLSHKMFHFSPPQFFVKEQCTFWIEVKIYIYIYVYKYIHNYICIYVNSCIYYFLNCFVLKKHIPLPKKWKKLNEPVSSCTFCFFVVIFFAVVINLCSANKITQLAVYLHNWWRVVSVEVLVELHLILHF